MSSNALTVTGQQTSDLLFQDSTFSALERVANVMSKGVATVPAHLRGKPADCFAVCLQAFRWGMDPFVVAQKTYIVGNSGILAYEAQLVHAVVRNSGAVSGPFRYEYRGDGQDLECRAGAVLSGDTAITWTQWLKNKDVKVRNSPLWNTNPAQQLAYVQVRNWARLYAPEAILGVYAADELDQLPVDIVQAPCTGNDSAVIDGCTGEILQEKPVKAAATITEEDANYIEAALLDFGIDRDRFFTWLNRACKVNSLRDLTVMQHQRVIEKIRALGNETAIEYAAGEAAAAMDETI